MKVKDFLKLLDSSQSFGRFIDLYVEDNDTETNPRYGEAQATNTDEVDQMIETFGDLYVTMWVTKYDGISIFAQKEAA